MREIGGDMNPDERMVAERRLLVSHVWWYLPQRPIWINQGEAYWFDTARTTLVVETPEGSVREYPCTAGRGPDARR